MNNKSLLLLVLSCLVGQSIMSMQQDNARKKGRISFNVVPRECLQPTAFIPRAGTVVTELAVGSNNFTEKLEEHMNKRKYAEIQQALQGKRALLRAVAEARNIQRSFEEKRPALQEKSLENPDEALGKLLEKCNAFGQKPDRKLNVKLMPISVQNDQAE